MKIPQGKSLVELLACLAIAITLACTTTPALFDLADRNRQTQWTNQMLAMLHNARSQAALGKRPISLCAGTLTCNRNTNWQHSVLTFIDVNGNGSFDANDKIEQTLALPAGASWHWSAPLRKPHLTYQPDGTTKALNGTLTLCLSGKAARQIKVSLSGRLRTQEPESSINCI